MKEIKKSNEHLNGLIDDYLNETPLHPRRHKLWNQISKLTKGNALAVINGRRQTITVEKREKEMADG